MKQLFTILAAVLFSAIVFAQTPQKMSYQAVIRNSSNVLVTNTQIGMQISILQGSASGTVVYTETQTPTTNANGLVSIEIGNGNVEFGDFSTIDWSDGSYFIKTETAIEEPYTTYTITGISQLLSVPYAFHAKTAETVTGGIIETDPIFGASVASGIIGTDTTNWNNKLDSYTETDPIFGASVASGIAGADTTNWNNKQDQLVAGTNISIIGNTISASSGATLTIGQAYQGGIIFWLDETEQHGLIAATADQSTGIHWYNGTYRYTGTLGDGLYAGAMNTTMIVATQIADSQTGNFAAKLCADYYVTVSGVTYGDWYLPSKYELYLLYSQRTAVGGFTSAFYWSSTESDDNGAWLQSFGNGDQYVENKFYTVYVRAVRAF